MKFIFRAALLCCLALAPAAGAQGDADDQYLGIYYLVAAADAFSAKEQYADALTKYTEARDDLAKFQTEHPDWNTNVVAFRLDYLQEKIAAVALKVPPPPAPPKELPPAPPVVIPASTPEPSAVVPAPAPVPPAAPVATAPVPLTNPPVVNLPVISPPAVSTPAAPAPAPAPPVVTPQAPPGDYEKNLADLQNQLRQALADRALLEAKLKEALSVQPAVTDPHELSRAQDEIRELQKQNALYLTSLEQARARHDQAEIETAANESLRRQLSDAQRKVDELSHANTELMTEDSGLPAPFKQPVTAGAATTALREENEVLKKKAAELQQRLDAALSQIAGGATRPSAAQVDETNRVLADLRARIDILEAHPAPYTPDELALISRPGTTSLTATAHSSGRKLPSELPAKAAALLSEAKRDVANHDLDKAELKYIDILKLDEKNIATLADLASIQVDLDHLSGADEHITAALAIEPDNEYSLFVLGRLRFKQQKFDDAFDALSRAAQLNPDNAEIQNYLGITLSEKGLRVPAEAALRKAVQIDPGYASAHVNLAFIYLSQQPPLVELARWHYEKAIAAGGPPNPAIEKLLAAPKAPPAAP